MTNNFFIEKDENEWLTLANDILRWCGLYLMNLLQTSLSVTFFSKSAAKTPLNQIPAPMTNIGCTQKVPNRVTCFLPIFSYSLPCNGFYSVYVLNAWWEFRLYSNLWGRGIFSSPSFFSLSDLSGIFSLLFVPYSLTVCSANHLIFLEVPSRVAAEIYLK